MYNFYKAIDKIKAILLVNGYAEYSNEISNRVQGGATGGEILSSVGYYIKHLDELSPDVHKLIKQKADDFIYEYAKIGYQIW